MRPGIARGDLGDLSEPTPQPGATETKTALRPPEEPAGGTIDRHAAAAAGTRRPYDRRRMSPPAPSDAAPAAATGAVVAPALALRDLHFAYGRRTVLDGVTLELAAGVRTALLGPNGSGKSTLMAIAAGVLRPARGTVARPAGVRAAGVVFQSPALDPWLTVRTNLVDAGRLQGLDRAVAAGRTGRLLDRLDLADRADDRVGTLSGGLARRADLARALLHEPDLLLLDEPTTGLDPAARASFLDLVDELAGEGRLAVLLATHLVDEADRSDRVVLLDRGTIVADAAPAALRSELGPRRLGVAGEDRPGAGAWERVPGGWSRAFDEDVDADALAALARGGRTITLAPPTLADVFALRTGRTLDDAGTGAGDPSRHRRGRRER